MTFAAHALPIPRERPPAPPLVPAVARALTLLERLARGREPMTLARLSSELELPKSSVHGLCTTLVSFGYLRRQADGSFLIGPRVMGLAEAFVAGTDVAQEFNALWGGGGLVPEETVVLSVLSGNEALYVAVRNSARPLGLAFNVGMRLPAYLSGSGKAMLAQLPADEVRRRFTGQLSTRLTTKGPRDVDALQRELALTRRRGWSVDDEAVREGVASFGAPVFDAAGKAVAGVAVCINKAQLGGRRGARHRDAALDVARRLTLRLGGEPPRAAGAPPRLRARAVAATEVAR
jgi:IclR family transcriptional regulator, blcABC operon repressor